MIVNSSLGVAVLALAYGGYVAVGDPNKATATTPRSSTVSTGTITSTVTGNGNLTSGSDTTVTATQCTGKLVSLAVSLGQSVTSGQVLGQIDTTTANQNLQAAKASLAQTQASSSASIASAQQSVSNAQASANLDASQAQDAVNRAQASYNADLAALTTTRNALIAARAASPKSAQAVTAAESSYNAAASKLSQDQSSLIQAQQQQATGQLKDSQQVSSAQTQLSQAQAGVGSSSGGSSVTSQQQTVDDDQAALAACTIKAPTDGMITALNASVGATVGSSTSGSGSSSTSSSTTTSASSSSGFATISDVSTMRVSASIAEADVASVKVGQPVTLTFPAVTGSGGSAGLSAQAKVTAIAPTSTVTSSVVTYSVTVTLEAPPTTVRLGQTANVTITTSSKAGVLRVSTLAITSVGGAKTVNRSKGASTGTVVITTGVVGGGFTEVVSGLQAGDVLTLPTTTTSTTTGTFGGRTGVGGIGATVGGR